MRIHLLVFRLREKSHDLVSPSRHMMIQVVIRGGPLYRFVRSMNYG